MSSGFQMGIIIGLSLPLAGAVFAGPKSSVRVQSESVLLEKRALTYWQNRLQSADWMDRWQAVNAIGMLGDSSPAIISSLTETFKDRDDRVQAGAAAAIARIGVPARPALEQLLRNGERRQRRWSAYALGRMGDRSAIPLLLLASEDSREDVREKAVESLRLLGYDDAQSVRFFVKGLKDSSPFIRFHSAMALGHSRPAISVAGPLTAALSDAMSTVRGAACESLGRLGPDAASAVSALTERLSDVAYVQDFAVVALGNIGTAAISSIPTLEDLARNSPSPRIREHAQWALTMIRAAK